MNKFLAGASMIAVTIAVATPVQAEVDQIVVTATKREARAQDIPVAVQAVGSKQLEQLNISNFTDYLQQLPNVSAGGSGPGQNTIYIRGLASTTPNLTTAGVAGLAPNVAFYLDEQPLAQPGRNLDVYAVDLQRIEVLPGPQGTLFGASSQAGTIRLITNKPKIGQFEAIAHAGISFTEGGDMSEKVDATINLPVTDKFALRGVVYTDKRGGFIDNVHGTRNASESARFRPAGTMRANGVPVSSVRAGFQAGADLSNVNFVNADNAGLVKDNFNDVTYSGFRIAGRYEFNNDWKLDVSHMRQQLDTDGVFFTDPELDHYEIQRYSDDNLKDKFNNTAWTLHGRLGMLDAVYTGAYTDRTTDQTVDYSDYLFVGQYLPYYICDGSVTYPGSAAPSGTCQAPNLAVRSHTTSDVFTNELRFNTPESYRLRATVGGFMSDSTLKERNDFDYPGSVNATLFGQVGFSPNYPFMTGYYSDPGPFPPGVIFRNDVKRTDMQRGIFGEVNFDLVPNKLTATFGTRYYDIDVDFAGGANSSFCNGFQPDANAYGTDISDLYNGDGQYTFRGTCDTSRHITYHQGQSIADIMAIDPALSQAQATQIFNALSAPDVAHTDGFIFKGNLSWRPTEDTLFYATYSQGFRPGLLNRPGGAQGPGGYTVPFELDTDTVNNYEIGWKTELMNRQLQFNGDAFYVEISNLQTTIFDPSITNLFFSDNAANAEIKGVEGNFTYQPDSIPGLTLAGAFSILDTNITKVLVPTNDVVAGKSLAYAPGFQGNIRARYEWNWKNDMRAYVMPQLTYSGSSRSDIIEINAAPVDSYAKLDFATGLQADKWSAELYVNNVTNTYGEISNNFVFDRERVTVIRPRTVGMRVSFRY